MTEFKPDPFAGLLARQQAAHDTTKARMSTGVTSQDRDRLIRARRRMNRIRVALAAGHTAAALAVLDEDDADRDEG